MRLLFLTIMLFSMNAQAENLRNCKWAKKPMILLVDANPFNKCLKPKEKTGTCHGRVSCERKEQKCPGRAKCAPDSAGSFVIADAACRAIESDGSFFCPDAQTCVEDPRVTVRTGELIERNAPPALPETYGVQ